MPDPTIRRDPCNLGTTLPNTNPDVAADPTHGMSDHPNVHVLAHEWPTIMHLGVDLMEMGAEDIAAAGGVVGHGAEVLHRFCERLGLPLAVFAHYRDFYLGIVCAATDGAVAGMMSQAFGGDELNRPSPGRQAAFAAILARIDGPETGPILAQLPADQRDDFLAVYDDMSRRSASGDRHFDIALTEARQQFGEILRQFGAGIAAALEGWNDDDRPPAFDVGHDYATRWMQAHPAEAQRARQEALANKLAGFTARANGEDSIDRRRLETDPSYRSGVHRAEQRIRRFGIDAVRIEAREMIRSRGIPLRGTGQCPVQG